jgi:hypothetical protein
MKLGREKDGVRKREGKGSGREKELVRKREGEVR